MILTSTVRVGCEHDLFWLYDDDTARVLLYDAERGAAIPHTA